MNENTFPARFSKAVLRLCRYPQLTGQSAVNPKGIVSFSPGLRGTSYPGKTTLMGINPKGVVANRHRHPSQPQPRWGCGYDLARGPRVARSSQPWALCRNPFG